MFESFRDEKDKDESYLEKRLANFIEQKQLNEVKKMIGNLATTD